MECPKFSLTDCFCSFFVVFSIAATLFLFFLNNFWVLRFDKPGLFIFPDRLEVAFPMDAEQNDELCGWRSK